MPASSTTSGPEETGIFDTHVHVWSPDTQRYPLPEGEALPPYPGDPGVLLQAMEANGITKALLVQAPWSGTNIDYLVQTIAHNRGRFLGLGHFPLPLPDDSHDLLESYRAGGLCGIRFRLLSARMAHELAAPDAVALIRRAFSLGMTVQLMYRDQGLHGLMDDLFSRFDEGTFVIDHLGHLDPSPTAYPGAWEAFLRLARRETVRVKASYHYWLSRTDYPWPDLHDAQERILEAFGPSRVMWGSNHPMHLPNPSYVERLAAVRDALTFLSPSDRSWILYRTAASAFKSE